MDNILQNCETMIVIIMLACVLVFFAITIDLVAGIHKAKMRGELRTSKALRRTINKFITYEGGLIIAGCVDILIHISNIFLAMHLDFLYDFPIVACCVAIFLLAVEWLSVREKASNKTKAQMEAAAAIIADILERDTVKGSLESVVKNILAENNASCNTSEQKEEEGI